MNKALKYGGQAAVYLLIAVLIGYFANAPTYTRVPPDSALIKLSFAHAATRVGECRRLSREELAKLAPNMRKPTQCPRERLPVTVEMEVNGKIVYLDELPPTGLSGDGASRTYRRIVLPAGRHTLVGRMRDTDRTEGFDHVTEKEVELVAGQSLAIDFDSQNRTFTFE
jgi:hypothetical protein